MTEKKKTLTQRMGEVELVLGGLLKKIDYIELDKDIKDYDIFGDPKRAGYAWTGKEKLSFIRSFLTFIESRALYHKRSVDALLAYLEHNDLLRHKNLKAKKEKLDNADLEN